MKKNNITYKKAHKVIIINKRKHHDDVKKIKQEINDIGHDNIISSDESHFTLNMFPNHGWARSNKRVQFIKHNNKRTSFSLICSVSNKKIIHYKIIESTVNAKTILEYVKTLNKKCRNKHYLFDNARVHHAKIVKAHMEGKTNKMKYNVPYNPKTNPIEQVFNKIKSYVIKENTSTKKHLIGAIERAINTITTKDLQHYFSNSFEK